MELPALVQRRAKSLQAAGSYLAQPICKARIGAYSAACLLILLAAYLFSCLTGTGILDRHGQVVGNDFLQFYAAGRLIGQGQGSQLYNHVPPFHFPSQAEVEDQIVSPQVIRSHYAFVLPPYYALPFVPLSALPYLPAYFAWLVVNIGLYLATLRLLLPHLAIMRGRDSKLVYLVALSFFPFLECLIDGQNSIVSLFLVVATYLALRKDRMLLAGICLGLLAYKPQLTLVLLLLCIVTRRWLTLATFVAVVAGLALVSFAIVGTKGIQDYLSLSQSMLDWVYIPGFKTWNMHSLYSFLALLLHDPVIVRALTIVASIGVLWLLLSAWRNNNLLADQYMIVVLATVLLSPHVFVYDLTLLVLPGLLLTDAIVSGRLVGFSAWLKVLMAAIYFASMVSRFSALSVGLQLTTPLVVALLCVSAAAISRVPSKRLSVEVG